MKKIICAIAFIIVSLTAMSQSFWTSYYNEYAEYNTYTKKWVAKESTYDRIEITMNGSEVFVDAKTPKTYYTYGRPYKSESGRYETPGWTATTWDCYWYRNGIKAYGDFRISKDDDGTIRIAIFYTYYGTYCVLSYYIE